MKKYGLILTILTLAVMMTACSMNTANTAPAPTAALTPGMNATANPDGMAAANDTDPAALTASMTTAESAALSKKANSAAAQVSEIDACVTAIVGNTCLAGVTFDKQYQGGMTDRIRDMVSARIQSVAPGVERVAVTGDPEIVAQINTVAERIAGAKAMNEVTAEFDGVLSRIR